MEQVSIQNRTAEGVPLVATFVPSRGMNLISYKKGECEVIAQETRPLFEERSAGLGALIGPHFHHRNPKTITFPEDPNLFPHFAYVRAKGIAEPFSHGIARYVPWTFSVKDSTIDATLSGKDEWKGIPLKKLEGQDFSLRYTATMTPTGLNIRYSVQSETDSVIGLHYYYALPRGTGTVSSLVKPSPSIPYSLDKDNRLHLFLNGKEDVDCNFLPLEDSTAGYILLDAQEYQLHTRYKTTCAENSWQLYQPKGSSFVCIEPLTAERPRQPQLTVSSIVIDLEVTND